jgi:diketogulonate reductase-like aldo/keto reductase
MIEPSDFRATRIPFHLGAGRMPALGFGTLIPDPAVTITATRDALEAGFRHFDCAERWCRQASRVSSRKVGQHENQTPPTALKSIRESWIGINSKQPVVASRIPDLQRDLGESK